MDSGRSSRVPGPDAEPEGPASSRAEGSGTPSEPPSTAARLDEALRGGSPTLTIRELAAAAGVSEASAWEFWRSLGFAGVERDAVSFTPQDVEAVRRAARLEETGLADARATRALVRAIGHGSDRLALWQVEALVEDVKRRFELDDTTARILVLDRLPDLIPELEELVRFGWRRMMAALVRRTHDDVSLSYADLEAAHQLPLARAIGFADLVAFTQRSAGLGPRELAALVEAFEDTARDVVTAAGARVVKMIGDAVLFVADDLATAARVALDLLDAIRAHPAGLSLRSSVVWGRVLSRSGDVFGECVNLASRLADVAEPGTVLMDRSSAAALAEAGRLTGIALVPQEPKEVSGLGLVAPVELRRVSAHEAAPSPPATPAS